MMENFQYYADLIKPDWAPPAWLFGPVWSVLYLIIAISFGFVFYKIASDKLDLKIGIPFALNIFFNVIFTPIQFGLQNNWLASLDILLVLLTIIWLMRVIYPKYSWVAYANIPYLIWVSFATILQLTITFLNI